MSTDITVYLTRDTDAGEVEVEATVRVHEARRATPPSYASGGDPPEPAWGEVVWAELLDGQRTPVDLTEREERKAIEEALLEYAD